MKVTTEGEACTTPDTDKWKPAPHSWAGGRPTATTSRDRRHPRSSALPIRSTRYGFQMQKTHPESCVDCPRTQRAKMTPKKNREDSHFLLPNRPHKTAVSKPHAVGTETDRRGEVDRQPRKKPSRDSGRTADKDAETPQRGAHSVFTRLSWENCPSTGGSRGQPDPDPSAHTD